PVGMPQTIPYTISGMDYTQAPNSAFNWSWTESNGELTSISSGANSTFPTLEPAVSTTYIVTAADPVTGCAAMDTMTLNINNVYANAGSDQAGVCEGTLIRLGSSLNVNNSVAGATFQWSPTAGLNDPIGTTNSTSGQPYLTVPNAPSGITYTLTVTDPDTGCQATDDVVITSNTTPPGSMTNQVDAGCPGSPESAFFGSIESGATYDLSVVSGGGDLSWFTSPTSNSTSRRVSLVIPQGTAAGTYVFQVTKTKGVCGSTTALYTITVNEEPTLTLAASPPVCGTPFTAITSTPDVRFFGDAREYLYTTDAGTTNIDGSYYSTVYIEPSAEERVLRGSTSSFCSSSIVIPASTTETASAGISQSYCEGDAPIQLGEANSGTSHEWTAIGFSSTATGTTMEPTAGEATTMLGYLSSTTANTPTFSQTTHTPGIYIYEMTSTFGDGCFASAQVTITVADPIGDLVGGSQQTCIGGSVTLGISPAAFGYNYSWTALEPSSEGYTISNATSANPTVNPVVTTTYRLIATNSATGCQSIQTVTVSVTEQPDIADVDMVAQCAPISAVDLTAQIPNYGTYFNPSWTQNSVPGAIVATPTSVMPTQTTEYFLVAENEFGCPDTAKVTVNVESPVTPIVVSMVNTSCPVIMIDLADYQGSPSNPAYTLEWHTANNTNVGTLVTNTVVGVGTYYLFETTPIGCVSTSDELVYTISGRPTLSAASSNPTTCGGNDGSITLTLTNVPDGTYTINYMDDALSAQTFTNIAVASGSATISGLSEGTYNDLSITVNGCTSTEDIDFTLMDAVSAPIATTSTTCSDNGTGGNTNDDTFTITVNATNTNPGASGQYLVIYNGTTLNGSGTAYDADIVVSHPDFVADGSFSPTLTIRDVDDAGCEVMETVAAVANCSTCPATICLPISVTIMRGQ
ncbi:MAG: hypothetical protein AB8G22_03025, partial [Saprospiraceae bacterium]